MTSMVHLVSQNVLNMQPYTGSTRPILKIVVPKFISEFEYIFDIIDGVKISNIAIAFFFWYMELDH
jgi:hypothetical protein